MGQGGNSDEAVRGEEGKGGMESGRLAGGGGGGMA